MILFVIFSLFDSNEERYQNLKANIESYIGIQFGITTFEFKDNCYKAQAFSFYVFPKALPSMNPQFKWQSESIEFLCKHNFDFNKVKKQ